MKPFAERIQSELPVGSILENPGGGTSTITDYSQAFITYRRGKSSIHVSYENLFKAYCKYQGQQVRASDLKTFAPNVFDSAARPSGHSCNATFMFLLLGRLGLAGEFEGKGVRGGPLLRSTIMTP